MKKPKKSKDDGFVLKLVRAYRKLRDEVGPQAARPMLVTVCSDRFGPMGGAVMEEIARQVEHHDSQASKETNQ